MTNAEKIQSMTVHELAELLCCGEICETCIVKNCDGIPQSEVCVKNTEKWLESEAPSAGIDWGGQE